MRNKLLKFQDLVAKKMLLKKYKSKNNIYVFAEPRGGSTWLTEILRNTLNTPVIWEPFFNQKRYSNFKDLGFSWRQHIPKNTVNNDIKKEMTNLFNGKLIDRSLLRYSNFKDLFFGNDKLLFKFCFANGLLEYIVDNFDFNFKPIYLIRHPFAVALSQHKHGNFYKNFKGFSVPKGVYYENYYEPHMPFLKSLETDLECLVAHWCIDNRLNFESDLKHKWIQVYYEDIVLRPRENLEKILNTWGMSINIGFIDFNKKSVTSIDNLSKSPMKRISQWRDQLTTGQIEAMQNVLDYFNIELYSKNSLLNKFNNEI